MAFPGTYNINYYKGDTFEFRIYPKDASGAPFDLTGYQSSDVKFSIAAARGADEEDIIEGYTEIAEDLVSILCVITPTNALAMTEAQYVYDVEIGKHGENYDIIHTLLTGVITITDEVTPIRDILPPVVEEAPGPISAYALGTVTDSAIQVGWTAPTTGGDPTGYKLYIVEYNPLYESVEGIASLISGLSAATPFTTTDNFYVFTETNTTLLGPGTALAPETAYVFAIVATNDTGDSSPVGNFDAVAGTIDEVTTEAGV